MNDNDIIKALRCCVRNGICTHCPLYKPEQTGTCVRIVMKNALDLIERLKAEDEELKGIKQILTEDEELRWDRELLTDKDMQEREAFERLMEIAEMTEGEA